MLDVSRSQLGITCSSKGLVAGDLVIHAEGGCRPLWVSIAAPHTVQREDGRMRSYLHAHAAMLKFFLLSGAPVLGIPPACVKPALSSAVFTPCCRPGGQLPAGGGGQPRGDADLRGPGRAAAVRIRAQERGAEGSTLHLFLLLVACA